MIRFFCFLIGFGFSVIGFVYIINYLNLFAIGYNFKEYVHFIFSKLECMISLIGLAIIFLTIFIPGDENNELYL